MRGARQFFLLALLSLALCSYYFGVEMIVKRAELNEEGASLLSEIKSKKTLASRETVTAATAAPAPDVASETVPPSAKSTASSLVHCMYYPWYGNPTTDKEWYHWNHDELPHWNAAVARQYPRGKHKGGEDVGASFYPELGAYSSRDPKTVKAHMTQMQRASCGVVVVSWYPPGTADGQGKRGGADAGMPMLFDAAEAAGLKIAFHIEPYDNRNPVSVRRDVEYITKTYGKRNGLFRPDPYVRKGALYYMYDSYHNSATEWARLLTQGGDLSVRGTPLDGTFICLVVEQSHLNFAVQGGFDGMYTYFASPISYGAQRQNWGGIGRFGKDNGLLWVPCVGPGYDDVRVRPWNQGATRAREDGEYYSREWKAALHSSPSYVGVTSFNEWHEGTQIEPAVALTTSTGFAYQDYGAGGPNMYLDLTRKYATELDAQAGG